MKVKVIEFERREGDTRRFDVATDLYLFNEVCALNLAKYIIMMIIK